VQKTLHISYLTIQLAFSLVPVVSKLLPIPEVFFCI